PTHTSSFSYEPPTSSSYTLSLHDALPIYLHRAARSLPPRSHRPGAGRALRRYRHHEEGAHIRSELANAIEAVLFVAEKPVGRSEDRKSTRLNSSHVAISYAVFCLKKKKMG